jgi:hypothetical protein
MKCKHGDQAKIIMSIRAENIGKEVRVSEYIGKFEKGETFQFRGIPCVAAVGDHYWWILGNLTTAFGDTPKAYIADSWLEPLRPTQLSEKEKETVNILI